MIENVKKTIDAVVPVDVTLKEKAIAHLDKLTKPKGSLGRLEEIATKYCLIKNTLDPCLGKKRICIFAGDHGIADRGVSAFPKEVTYQMVCNMLSGGAAINVLGRHAQADVRVADVGVAHEFKDASGLVQKKVSMGTADFTVGPAMSSDEVLQALEVGMQEANSAYRDGISMVGTGDMGIGNTTAASALMAALLPCKVEDIVGRGTGINDETLALKINAVKTALAVNNDRLDNPLNTLAALGGLEIAAIAGFVIGAASKRIAVAVDGFISTAGALAAYRMAPAVLDYLFFSHKSAEIGHSVFFELTKNKPILDLEMRLGEGTGAALAMNIIEASVKIYCEMAVFDTAGVSNRNP